jgi:hypothetical protein
MWSGIRISEAHRPVSDCSSLRGAPPVNNDPRIVSGIFGVAEPITVPTW